MPSRWTRLLVLRAAIGGVAAVLVLWVGVAHTLAQPPPLPHSFYGDLYFNGQPAPLGTEVTAWMEGNLRGCIRQPGGSACEATTKEGMYGGPGLDDPKMVVAGASDSEAGLIIHFFVLHPQATTPVEASQTHAYQPGGGPTQLDLFVQDTQSPTAAPGPDQQGTVGEELTFDGSASTDNTWIASYQWDFGDGAHG